MTWHHSAPKLYIIGALKNLSIMELGKEIRGLGYDVFDDWISPGPEADEHWQSYEDTRGRSYLEAIYGHHADTVFQYDFKHLNEADTVVLVLPSGKSAHLEFGWAIGQGKKGYVLFDDGEPTRYDIMYRFADGIFMGRDDLSRRLISDLSLMWGGIECS